MGTYTQLSQKELQSIIDLYGFGQITSYSSLALGISNSNYKVTTAQGDYVAKVSNDKDAASLESEQNILYRINNLGFHYCPAAYETKNGEKVYHHKNHFGTVSPFITGHAPEINENTAFQIGKTLGNLHKLSEGADLSDLRTHEQVGYDAIDIQTYVNSSPECPEDFKEIFHSLFSDQLEGYCTQKFPSGLIHGDLYYDNTLFEDGNIHTLIDFEQSGVGPFIFDIGVSISGTCLIDGVISCALTEKFLEGYNHERKLESNESQFMSEAILVGLLSISLWRIKRFVVGDIDPSKVENYKELLSIARDYHKALK
ncbi:MAG: phosphotransferase [Bacteriovoracaceae bacterium]|jgi:homoserine kinase type II|nr:phosphotransferase [Bacteriovoracaceae bacterium]